MCCTLSRWCQHYSAQPILQFEEAQYKGYNLAPVDGRKRYVVSVSGDTDIRPEIFSLAKKLDWVLWELHEDRARLEDVFHSLTAEAEDEEGEG